MFGKTHTDKAKAKLSISASNRFKGKSYEDLYGVDKTELLKQKRSNSTKGKNHSFTHNPRFDYIEYTFHNQANCH